jgi:hypothetical protein
MTGKLSRRNGAEACPWDDEDGTSSCVAVFDIVEHFRFGAKGHLVAAEDRPSVDSVGGARLFSVGSGRTQFSIVRCQ